MSDPTPAPDDDPATALSLLEKYPVLIFGGVTLVVTALLNVLVSFGIPISDDSTDKIGKLVDAVGGLALLVMLYRKVTSNAKVVQRVTNAGTVVAGDAALEPTGSEALLIADTNTGLPVAVSTVNPKLVGGQDLVDPADLLPRENAKRPRDSSPGNAGSLFD